MIWYLIDNIVAISYVSHVTFTYMVKWVAAGLDNASLYVWCYVIIETNYALSALRCQKRMLKKKIFAFPSGCPRDNIISRWAELNA